MSYKGKINVYTCSNGHNNITKDIDEGVTPFMIICQECKKDAGEPVFAESSFYNVEQTLIPTIEWYAPNEGELEKLDEASKNHCNQGGLLMRKIG